jgi:uncharacterized protein (DUF1697 family)
MNRGGHKAVRCIALLRGINVSGQKIVKMTDLKKAFESLSFEKVRTYGQSGNVIFDCMGPETTRLATRLKKKVRRSLWVFDKRHHQDAARTREDHRA